MMDNPKQASAQAGSKGEATTDASDARLERRLFIFRATFFVGGVGALAYYAYRQHARRQIEGPSDNDPSDPRGRGKSGKGRTRAPGSDNDPSDPEGGGKGGK